MTAKRIAEIKRAVEVARKIAKAMSKIAYKLTLVRDIDDRKYVKVYSNEKLLTEREISEKEYELLIEKFEDYSIVDEITKALEYIFETLKLKNIIRDYEIEYDYHDKDIANTKYYYTDIYVTIYTTDKKIIKKLAKEFKDAITDENSIKVFIADVLEAKSAKIYLLVNDKQRVEEVKTIYVNPDSAKEILSYL